MAKYTIGTGLWSVIRGYLNSMFTELYTLQTSKQDALGYTAENTANKNVASGYAGLGTDGKVGSAQLPSLVITTPFVVASEAAMLALAAIVGNLAIRTDTSKTYVLSTLPATVLGNWVELLSPTGAVLSVFGRTDAVTAASGDYTADQITQTATREFVTPAQKTIINNQSGVNTGNNAVNTLYSSLVTNATHTGDATGSGALTLATVNANVGTFTNATMTVNAKGLVTAASSGSGITQLLTTNFRIIERAGEICVDQILTATGFAGTESTDVGVTGDWIKIIGWKHEAI